MPFDAGMTAAAVYELNNKIIGARIEKIYQPEKDEVIFLLKREKQIYKLLLCVRSSSSRIGLTNRDFCNPASAPMFCMLLRKHLSGAHVLSVSQLGFERAVRIDFSAYDELGFVSKKSIIVEITGRYTNIILCNEAETVISALRLSDIMSNDKRKLICGYKYEPLPLPENRESPLGVSKESFFKRLDLYTECNGGQFPADKYLVSSYAGISPLLAREIVYRSSKSTDTYISLIDKEKLYFHFSKIYGAVEQNSFTPYLLADKSGKVLDFSFCEIFQYEQKAFLSTLSSFAELFDTFFEKKDQTERIKQNAQDILKLLSNASARISKKTELQRADLAECDNMTYYKTSADLLTAYLYMLKKGQKSAVLYDYTTEKEIEIPLDETLTPAQNAQKYYKKYNKYKTAKVMLEKQIELSNEEQKYIDSVFESLTKATSENDLAEIRDELNISGYGKKLASLSKTAQKKAARAKSKKSFDVMKFRTTDGYEVLCGKNNLQNDHITANADKSDYWFHIKGYSGSHVIMKCKGEEPPAQSFTQCAMIAAFYSGAKDAQNVTVDYTRAKNVKKPSGAKPGFVIYDKFYSAVVTPDEEIIKSLKA